MSIQLLLQQVRGKYKEHFNLAHLTRFGVGGNAELFFKPEDQNDLAYFLANLPQHIPITILGAGSNIIIRDGGIHGITIKLGKGFSSINSTEIENVIVVGAGTLNYNVAQWCLHNGLSGLEFLMGIPGSIGGGIAMNAGAYGKEFKDVIHSIEAFDRSGHKHVFYCKDLRFVYRQCIFEDFFIFTKAHIYCQKSEPKLIAQKINKIMELRKLTQPINQRTAGSTFRNPGPYNAWKLIDKVKLRGYTLGGAQVSNLHCNFLINLGNASADDLESLGEFIRKQVLQQIGIKLEWEIKIVGNKKNCNQS